MSDYDVLIVLWSDGNISIVNRKRSAGQIGKANVYRKQGSMSESRFRLWNFIMERPHEAVLKCEQTPNPGTYYYVKMEKMQDDEITN